jgi:NAD(P)H-dependent flavin oxidoreductase YrpB (nitropropane dioxygenase family)
MVMTIEGRDGAMWLDNRIQNLFGIELPIIQAPMAGVAFSDMVIGVSEAGGLGSLACALLTDDQIIEEVKTIRRQTSRDRVLVVGFDSGRVKATNRTFEEHWVTAFAVRNGKVTNVREYIDTLVLARGFEMAASPTA